MGTAGAVEILRAAQKDNIFIDKFANDVQEVVESLLGKANFLKWRNTSKLAAIGLYFSLTNLAGYQTLGEEYAGLVQTDSSKRKASSKRMIIQMILLQVFGHSVIERGLKNLIQFLRSSEENGSQLSSKTTNNDGGIGNEIESKNNSDNNRQSLVSPGIKVVLAQIARHSLPFLLQLHLAIFYIQGKFYHISKRITGIHYVLVRSWFANQDENSQNNLKYLRLMSVINLLLTAIHDSIRFLNSQQTDKNKTASMVSKKEEASNSAACDPARKCSLCLEIRKNPTLSQCGHLFCWECIMDWIQTKEECPICRTGVTPSRLVPLQNHF